MSDTSQESAPTRARCPHCLRALRSCICALVQPVAHQVQLLILMHPDEVHEAKGTGHREFLQVHRVSLRAGKVPYAVNLEKRPIRHCTGWGQYRPRPTG